MLKGQITGGIRVIGAMVALLLLAVFLASSVAARSAWADEDQVLQMESIAEVETNASVTVSERRIIWFAPDSADPRENALKWDLGGFARQSEIAIKRVRWVPVNAEGQMDGDWKKLKEAPFLIDWREEAGPDQNIWSLDKARSTLYLFLKNRPERVMVEATYKVDHAVVAYDDAAEFTWRYASRSVEEPLHNVEARVILPVPADQKVVPGANVRAWGHGPADGLVDISPDGSLTFSDPEVPARMFAEARVLFPVEWMTNLSVDDRLAHQGSLRYDTVERAEEEWIDSEIMGSIMHLRSVLMVLVLCAVALAASLVAYFIWGRERTPSFIGAYRMQEPSRSAAPAVMGRLWRWNHTNLNDIVATVADMIRRGRLKFCSEGASDASQWSLQLVKPDQTFEQAAQGAERSLDDGGIALLDAATLRLLDALACGQVRAGEPTEGLACEARSVTAGDIARLAQDHPGFFVRALDRWQQQLTREVAPHAFFDPASKRAQHVFLVVAAVLVLVGIWAGLSVSWEVMVVVFATAAAVGVMANYTMRRSPEGNELAARSKALRNFLRDGGWDDDSLSPEQRDVLVPYGFLFGAFQGASGELADDVRLISATFDSAYQKACRRAEAEGSDGRPRTDQDTLQRGKDD